MKLIIAFVVVLLAQPAVAATKTDRQITAYCKKEWPHDYAMQEYCIDKQTISAVIVKTWFANFRNNQFVMGIMNYCLEEWPDDWAMTDYCISKQLEAAERLKKR